MKKNNNLDQYINAGGINGLGEGFINTNNVHRTGCFSCRKTRAIS